MHFKERLEKVEAAIAQAAVKSGRRREDITLVAVTKGATPEAVREAAEAGLTVFGENKVQEAELKIPASALQVQWHMVGHLQSNKVAPAVSLFHMIQSVDSVRVA